MKRFLLSLAFVIAASSGFAAEAEWLTDAQAAQAKASAEHKYIMLDFTGSDWCGWCKKLKSEVFDQPEFIEFAKAHLLLVEVDFPRTKQLSSEQREANDRLAATYGVQGYPTIILLDEHGNKVGRTGYLQGGPKPYIAQLEKITGLKHFESSEKPADPAEPDEPRRPPPAFVPIAPAAPIHYGDLALKAISGGKDRRMALINNQTLEVGETANVKVRDSKVKVTVKEIRADSVLITADGKSQELKLAKH